MAFNNQRASRPIDKPIFWTDVITINGAIDEVVLLDTSQLPPAWASSAQDRVGVITNVLVQYITASDTNETQNIRIGRTANRDAHASNINTESGKVAGDVVVFPQSVFDAEPRIFTTDKWLQVEFVNSTGAGSVKVGVEISYDYSDWVDFNPQNPN